MVPRLRLGARYRAILSSVSEVKAHLFEPFFTTKGVGKGKRIWKMDEEWKAACEKAKVPGRLFHDLRRTAVRNMIRAGVPQSVAMAITGHRTISMFLRYNITSDHDMRDALRKTQAHVAAQFEEQKVVDIGRLGQNSDSPKDG
jgi:integrase